MKFRLALIPLVAALAAASCQSSKPAASPSATAKPAGDVCDQKPHESAKTVTGKPINTICPIGHDAVYDGSPRVSYQGHVIAFCCEGCYAKWEKMDDAARSAMLKTMLASK